MQNLQERFRNQRKMLFTENKSEAKRVIITPQAAIRAFQHGLKMIQLNETIAASVSGLAVSDGPTLIERFHSQRTRLMAINHNDSNRIVVTPREAIHAFHRGVERVRGESAMANTIGAGEL